MDSLRKLWACWKSLDEVPKILVVAIISFALTYFFLPKTVVYVGFNEYRNTETGDIVPPRPCTRTTGPDQCKIYKDEFVTQDTATVTISKKSGSTTCCLTSDYNTSGGEVTSSSESCWTTKKNLASCPSGYTKK